MPGHDNGDASNSWLARLIEFCSRPWIAYALLALGGIMVHLPALTGTLIWDDAYLSRDNPFIKSPYLALETFRHFLFADSFSGHYRPVQTLSYMFDYWLWNADSTGYHLTNIILHAGSGLLLFCLLQKLIGAKLIKGARIVSFAVAAIWVVHPVHSAAVDYISGRADSLAFLFCAAAWLFVLIARESARAWQKIVLFSLAALLALLGLCSREIACVWIALFLIHTFAFTKIPRRAKFAALTACTCVLFVYTGLRSLPASRAHPPVADEWGLPLRSTLALRALGDYTRLLVFPGNLHMERSVFDPIMYESQTGWRNNLHLEYLAILGALAALWFVWGCAKKGAARPLRIFGALWFFVAYLPVSNLVLLNATCAEHWLYLPSIGFFLFVAGWIIDFRPRLQRLCAAAALLAVVALGGRAAVRSSDWTDELTFYTRTMAAGGGSGRIATNLGVLYLREKQYDKAEKIFRRILQFTPDYVVARNNLGDALLRQGKTVEAEKVFADLATNAPIAAKTYPRTWIGILNLAHVRAHAKDDAGAIALLEGARRDYPEIWELVSLEAELTRRVNGPDRALEMVEQFNRANWWHHGAALAAGRLYAQKNDTPRATEALERAARLDVHDVNALDLLARIYVGENKFNEAYTAQKRAVARQPDEPGQYLMLAEILDKMGRADDSRKVRDEAQRLESIAARESVALN